MKTLPLLTPFLVLLAHGVAACGGSTSAGVTATAAASAREEAPQYMLDAPDGTYGTVLSLNDELLLFGSFARGFEAATDLGVDVPAGCMDAPTDVSQCPQLFEGTPALQEQFADAPSTVMLLGPEGSCEAQVGPAVVLNTSGCEASVTMAQLLTGCSGPVARVARLSGLFGAELRYVPGTAESEQRVPSHDAVSSVAPSDLRDAVAAVLAPHTSQTINNGLALRVAADAGSESLVSLAAGFEFAGDSAEECDVELVHQAHSGIVRDGQVTPVQLTQWEGVIAWHGQVVGVVTGAPHFTTLHALTSDYALRSVFEQRVWMDNEECGPFEWAYVEAPCGP